METQGFYKLEDDNLMYAPNFIFAPNYELRKELKDTYVFPVDGWHWFDSEELAKRNLLFNGL